MRKYLFPFLNVLGTTVLRGTDACWAAVAVLTPNRQRGGSGPAVDNTQNQRPANSPNCAVISMVSEMSLAAGTRISKENAGKPSDFIHANA